MPENNIEISIRVQEKFEYYFLSLTFVISGLSIQTAEFGFSMISDTFELFGWLNLFMSCLIGLWRMEWLPQIYKVAHEKSRRLKYYNEAIIRKERGEEVVIDEKNNERPIDEFLADVDEGIRVVQKQIEVQDKKNILKYRFHKYTFVLGLIFLVCSSGYEPFLNVLNQFR